MLTVTIPLPQHSRAHHGESVWSADPTQTPSHCHFTLYLRIRKGVSEAADNRNSCPRTSTPPVPHEGKDLEDGKSDTEHGFEGKQQPEE